MTSGPETSTELQRASPESKALVIYPEHGYQITAYADAIEALTGDYVIRAYVVRLPKEGGEDSGYECREVLDRGVAQRTFRAAHQLWAAHRNAKEMW